MKTCFITIVLCFCTLFSYSQALQLEKASPFTAVQWEDEQPLVQFENEWYTLISLDSHTTKELLDFCKEEYGPKWKKRFSEDLVAVLKRMGSPPNTEVALQLKKGRALIQTTATFTFENRQQIVRYNNEQEKRKTTPKKVSGAQALEDISEFQQLLETRSSYLSLSTFDYKNAIGSLKANLTTAQKDVNINYLTHELAKIMAEIGDRHASVKNEVFQIRSEESYGLKIPFGLAVLDGKIIAVKKQDAIYDYYHEEFPMLKSIDGMTVETMITTYNYRDKKAPMQAKLLRGAKAIEHYGALLIKNNRRCPDSISVVFTNGNTERAERLALSKDAVGYVSQVESKQNELNEQIKNGNLSNLSKRIGDTIGYIRLPEMYSYREIPDLETELEHIMQGFSDTKALIIDIRSNPGGTREILQTLAKYIVQPAQSPWVANVAYLRTDTKIVEDEESMNARFLYTVASERFTKKQRDAINSFAKKLIPEKKFDTSKFSAPHYMVLQSGTKPYKQPVYILVNEQSFSAASVFTSAFKELPNVTIVGQTTDGSSGNSAYFYLQHSNIRVKVSTMLSFQRNGKSLDGHGTIPDPVIPETEEQVLNGVDLQLKKLIANILKE